jgi:hypothetical protein
MFAPVLFIGAMIGGAIGGLEHHFFPQISASVAPFALVGMGTFFAGFLRVPITSVFMVVETSGSYSIVLPVMISNTIAYLISRKYQDVALFDLLAKQDDLELPSMEEQREQIVLRVEDAMRKPDLPHRCRPATRSLAPWKLPKPPPKKPCWCAFRRAAGRESLEKNCPRWHRRTQRRRNCARFCPQRGCPFCIPISGWMTRCDSFRGTRCCRSSGARGRGSWRGCFPCRIFWRRIRELLEVFQWRRLQPVGFGIAFRSARRLAPTRTAAD